MRRFMAACADDGSGRFTIIGEDARHIEKVLRKKAGDKLEIVLPTGEPAICIIESSKDGTLFLDLIEQVGMSPEANKSYVLVQCLPKGQKMDFVIEKCTEMGFGRFIPAVSERCIVREVSEGKLARWRKLAHEAAKQSGRTKVPTIDGIAGLNKVLADASQKNALLLFFWESEEVACLKDLEGEIRAFEQIYLIIGPEGGLSENEAALAISFGAKAVSLGPRILRTETAPVVAGAIVMYIAGELGPLQNVSYL
jgi:16S rRNA (uracil1498-N3)-methyltransferase